jgi:DNA-binding NarL/FixJ family response regulator
MGTGSGEPLQVLIVEDDATWANTLQRRLRSAAVQPRLCGTVARAYRQFCPEAVDALVLDVGLPDGSGLTFLGDVRAQGWRGASLVQTGSPDPGVVNHAHELDAQIVIKPYDLIHLGRFLERARRRRRALRSATRPGAFAATAGLTPTEHAIFDLLRQGHTQASIAAHRKVALTTVKTQVRAILRKTGHPTVRHMNARLAQPTPPPANRRRLRL